MNNTPTKSQVANSGNLRSPENQGGPAGQGRPDMALQVWISTFASVVFFAWFAFHDSPSASVEANSPVLYALLALGVIFWWLGWYLPPRMNKATEAPDLTGSKNSLSTPPPLWSGPDLIRFITRLALFEGTVITGFVATRLSADMKWITASAGLILLSLARNFPTEKFRRDWQFRQ